MVAVLAGVEEGGDGVEGGVGDLGVDGGLVTRLVPGDGHVEDSEQAGFEGGRELRQDVAEEGKLVQEVGVGGLGGGLGQRFELGFEVFALVVEVGEAGTDPGAHGGGGVVGVGGDLL